MRAALDTADKSSSGPPEGAPWLQYSVLVVDDEEGMRSFLCRVLSGRCGAVDSAASVEAAREVFGRRHFDLVVLDISLPGTSGLAWLDELREGGFQSDVILITAFADIETAIRALRAGASDFILKPFRVDQMLNSIGRCFDRARLLRENFVLRREVQERSGTVEGMVGRSAAARELSELIRRVADTPSTVLLQGESGVGKEVAARGLHAMSRRAQGPFVPVNCAAIAAELIESELFGHIKGAFTGAAEAHHGLFYYAQGGTLFLDEIGELPWNMQTKLLRVLDDRRVRPVGSTREIPVDIRVIAATNRNLGEDATQGRFRQDLFYRLNVVSITLRPLRERREDIGPLARHFIEQLAPRLGVAALAIGDETLARLEAYDWPGNVRELKNLVERALILGEFPDDALPQVVPSDEPSEASDAALAEVEKRHILEVLASCGGNKSEAARRLGVSRKTVERKCAQWGV